MFFGIFKKKDCPIHEEYFLKIEWNVDFSLKNSEIHSIVEIVDREDHSVKLEQSLPYMTFAHAESLFINIKETFVDTGRLNEFPINKLSVVHREENEAPTTEGEVFISNFVIQRDYQNILKLLVESIIYQKDFNDGSLTYDTKRSYMMDTIYPNYLESIGVSDNTLLPVFPSEQDIELGTAEVIVPAFNPVPIFEEEQIEQEENNQGVLEDSIQDDQYIGESEEAIIEQEPVTYEQPGYSLMDDLLNNNEPEQFSHIKPTVQIPVNITDVDHYHENTQIISTEGAEVSFPKFTKEPLEKETYEPHEDDYVTFKLNELKNDLNKKIQENEARNNDIAIAALKQQIKNYENLEMQKISNLIAEADKRNELKPAVMAVVQQRKHTEWTERNEDLKTEKANALEIERLRYEKAVKEIENDFSKKSKQLRIDLDKSYLETANNEYQEKYFSETGKLQKLLEGQLENLALRKMEKQQDLEVKLKNTGQKIGSELFEKYKRYLNTIEQQIISEHDYAKQVNLVERQEQIKRTSEQQMADYLKQLQNENLALRKEREHLEANLVSTKEEIIDQKVAYITNYEKREAEKKLQVAETNDKYVPATEMIREVTDNNVNSEKTVPSESKFKNSVIALMVIFGLAAASFTAFNGYQFNQLKEELTSSEGVFAQTQNSREKEAKEKEDFATQQSESEKRIIDSVNKSYGSISDFNSRLENVEKGINSLVDVNTQEEYNFPIVEGGTPTNQYFTGKGTITNH